MFSFLFLFFLLIAAIAQRNAVALTLRARRIVPFTHATVSVGAKNCALDSMGVFAICCRSFSNFYFP
jgi:hypothetical protein